MRFELKPNKNDYNDLVRNEQPDQAAVTGLYAGFVARNANRIAAIIRAKRALR